MQIFHDMSNLLTIFQMSYIYHQVTIMAYKILIKNICIINTPYGNKNIYDTVTKCKYKLNNHLSRGSEEQYNDVKLQI